mmetsp:Transcript_11042/g.31011  ORF Transcript_11042/g.31011 Transcript_11042/m.31011 type:complete len:275 (+) Transcript_11042:285-1109(+)
MRPSAIHAVAGAVLCSAATGFQEIAPTSLHPHTSSSSRSSSSFGPLHLASRANDNGGSGGSGRRSPGYVPFDGSGGPTIPGRGSKADDDEWFARQVQMAETERNGGGFGSRQIRSSQPRTSVTPPPAAPRASSARTTRPGTLRSAAAATPPPPNRSNERWPTIGTPTQQSTNRATAASTANRAAAATRAASAAAAAAAPALASLRYLPTLNTLHSVPLQFRNVCSFRATNDLPRPGRPTSTMTTRSELRVSFRRFSSLAIVRAVSVATSIEPLV